MTDHLVHTVRTPGLVLSEHEMAVPLDHGDPGGEQISVFAREVADPEGRDRPFLLFLQGGPGQEAERPTRGPSSPGWLDRALADYRVLMLDQRGTGRSSPVGTLPGLEPQEQAERLTHYRADAIVADAEAVRVRLGVERWSVLGESFGGFCALRYLSAAPDGLREAFFSGGLPPVDGPSTTSTGPPTPRWPAAAAATTPATPRTATGSGRCTSERPPGGWCSPGATGSRPGGCARSASVWA